MSQGTARKIAMVVGASRGIGRAVAERLASSGFHVWLTYRGNREAALEVQSAIEAAGGSCELAAFDIADATESEAAVNSLLEKATPDVLVFNAGITRDNLLVFMSREEWDAVLTTNLDGFYNVVRPVVLAMLKAKKKGRIVVVSSTSGQVGQAGQVNYSASKAGLIGAVKALAREVGKRNILVNVVAPGFIETDMTHEIPVEQVLPLIPLGRVGKADDVASMVNFLCSEENMYIHGQVIGINGGLVM